MTQATKIAKAVKNYLINLAIDDKLPMNLNELDENALEEIIQSFFLTDDEKGVEQARHYLCDGDISIKEMVERIAAHEDQDDNIDYVDGVVVWQKVENSFTCSAFLELIGY